MNAAAPLKTTIAKDNVVRLDAREVRALKQVRKVGPRNLIIDAAGVTENLQAKAIAVLHLSDAAIGGCGTIIVRSGFYKWQFDTKELNRGIIERWGRRQGMTLSPMEKQIGGAFYDTTRQLWAVPQNYNVRERVKFGTGR